MGLDSKPELQRVLEHRRRNQLIKQKEEEEEAKKLKSPFEQELLKRQQRLDQVENKLEICSTSQSKIPHQSCISPEILKRGRGEMRFLVSLFPIPANFLAEWLETQNRVLPFSVSKDLKSGLDGRSSPYPLS